MNTNTDAQAADFMLDTIRAAAGNLDRELAALIGAATAARTALAEGRRIGSGMTGGAVLHRHAGDVEAVAGRLQALVEAAGVMGIASDVILAAYTAGPEPVRPAAKVERGYPVTVDMTTAAVDMAEALDAAHATTYDQVKAAVGTHLIAYRRAKAAAHA